MHGMGNEAQRRLIDRRRTNPRPAALIPHGVSGYQKDHCRCEICKAGEAERRAKYRERRKAKDPRPFSLIPHGHSGYTVFACRCPTCMTAYANYCAARNVGAFSAPRYRYQWTGPELEIASRRELTAVQVAAMIGRSPAAVGMIRHRLKIDPRIDALAGTSPDLAHLPRPGA